MLLLFCFVDRLAPFRGSRNILGEVNQIAARSCRFNSSDRVWGYGRDSEGIEQQESVASQRRAIEKYCRQHNLVVLAEIPSE